MKKILFFIAILSAFISNAQVRQPQTLGSPMTDVYSKGTIGSDSGYVFRYNLPDTVNTGLIKNIPGIVIRVGNILYLRNQTVNAWIEIGTGSSTGQRFGLDDISATGNRYFNFNNNNFEIDSANNLTIDANNDLFINSPNLYFPGVTLTAGADTTGQKIAVVSMATGRVSYMNWLYAGGAGDTANLLVKRWGSGTSIFGVDDDTLLLKDGTDGVFTRARATNDSSFTFDFDSNSAAAQAWVAQYSEGGTASGFTEGSVIIVEADGSIGEDVGAFFWDNTNNRLAINHALPEAKLDIRATDLTQIRLRNTSGNSPSAGAFISVSNFDGSGASITDDRLGGLMSNGSTSSTLQHTEGTASIEFFAAENWSVGNVGTGVGIYTTPIGDDTRARGLFLSSEGQLTLNKYTTANFNGGVAADSVLVVTATGIVKKRDAASFVSSGMSNPLTTTGDIIYSSSGTTAARLGIGSANQVLTVISGVPSWQTPGAGSSTFVGLTDGPGAFTGQALKIPRVNAGETALEYTTAGIGDVVKVGTPVNNYLGVWTGDGTIEGDIDLQFNGTQLGIQGVPGYPLDIWNGSIAIVGGADNTLSTRTNNTTKNFRMGMAHYDNTDLPATVFAMTSTASSNELYIGGSTGLLNAISQFAVYTTSGNTTATGTEKLLITSTALTINDPGSATFDVRIEGDTDANAFVLDANGGGGGGGIGIGVAAGSIDSKLKLAAGTATAGTSPLKMTSGTLLTTAEAGAHEFLTDKYYGTITTGAARKEFTLNDAALTSGRVPYVTTNGRITDAAGMTFDGTGKLSLLDLTLTGLDVDAAPDTLTSIEGGVVSKYVIPVISGYTAVDSLMSGQYTPTLANVTNVAGTTAVLVNYTKVGNKVVVSGQASCTVTASGGTFTNMSMTLPFASNFTLVTDCAGAASGETSAALLPAIVVTNTTTDVAELKFYSGSGAHTIYFSFIYFVK